MKFKVGDVVEFLGVSNQYFECGGYYKIEDFYKPFEGSFIGGRYCTTAIPNNLSNGTEVCFIEDIEDDFTLMEKL
jgi:hypothetical protein